ncbi:MAG: hypothetical protein JNK58_03280 [Phycisphaerae bacterium]|nr:hypothetical protein [Phycisphaerae bacterium]
MELWTGAAIGTATATLAIALIIAGASLVRSPYTETRDFEYWFFAAIILLLIAGADRLTLLDGQLLVLVGLLFLWWNGARRSPGNSPPMPPTVVGISGLAALFGITFGVGTIAIAFVTSRVVDAVRTAPAGPGSLSTADALQIVAEVARSRPSLRGLARLAPDAFVAGFAAVAVLWITALRGGLKRLVSIAVGLGMIAAALLIALLAYSQIVSRLP